MKTVSIKLGKKNRLVKIYKLSNKMLKNHKVILTTTDLVHNNFIVNGFGEKRSRRMYSIKKLTLQIRV